MLYVLKHRCSGLFVLMGMVFLLGGCLNKEWKLPEFTSLQSTDRTDWTHLRRANYAAADVLYQGSKPKLNKFHRVELIKLNNLGEPIAEGTAPIAWLVPQQVGNRLAQLGLPVEQIQKAPLNAADKRADGTLPLQLTEKYSGTKYSTKREAGHLYVEGDYAYMQDEILIALRLIDGRTNMILSSIEYDLDVDANMFVLLDPAKGDRIFSTGWMR